MDISFMLGRAVFMYIVLINLVFGVDLACIKLTLEFFNFFDFALHLPKLSHALELALLCFLNHLSLQLKIIKAFRMLLLPLTCHACLVGVHRHVSEVHQVLGLSLCFNLKGTNRWHHHAF